MGYLVLNKAAGGTKILAGTNPYIQVTKADQKQELLGIETFNITIESKTPILFSVGDSIDVFGRRYWINDPQNVTIADTGDKFIYDIQMEGIQYRFINAVLFAMGISEYAPSTEVIYTANLLEALRLVITCVNFNEGWEMFVLDEATVPETKRMTLSFSDTNCLAALQTICGKDFFNVLFKFTEQQDGTYELRVGTTVGENLPYSFVVGQKGGAYDIKRNKGGNSGVSFTRLFAYGSSENISNSYRGYSSRLRLPGAVPAGYTLPAGIELVNDTQRNLNYVQLVGATHKVSTIKTYADIKPHRTGVVSGIDGSNVNRFFDASMDFDINEKLPNGDTKYLLNGQAAKVHFNTGKLAGLEFDATYNHSQKSFTLVSYADERGQTFPDPKTTTFRVSEGDEYVILNINMPDLYIEKAEKELLVAAVKDLQDSFSPANKYTVKIRELYLKKYESPGVQNNFFNVGDFVNVKNTAMNLDSNIQILSFTRSWLNPLNYTLELSDVVTISYMVQMLGAIEAINNVVSINKLDNPARTKRNWRVSEEIASKIETLRTDMVLVGKPEGQYDTNIKFEYNYGGNRNRIISTSGALIHSVYNEGVQAGTWNVGASDNTLTDSDGMKFVYIKAEVNSATAFIVFSDNEIGVDSVVGYYHFPYCILSSVLAGSRTATKFKGRTQVIGDEISTGHIKGNGLDIDLNSGTVTGKVKIVTANGSIKTVEQAIDEVEVGGANLIRNSWLNFETSAYLLFLADLTEDFIAGKQYTFSVKSFFDVVQIWVVGGNVLIGNTTYKGGGISEITFTAPAITTPAEKRRLYIYKTAPSAVVGGMFWVQLEKGNKATDWKPAHEDVTNAINTAQNAANTANQSVLNLNTYVDGAFKDGVIDSAEAKAIEKYINTVNTEYDNAISSYNVVANNSYLDGTPKTTLINAKVTLAGAKDSLMSAISTAIADGKTTVSEKAAVDAAYASYKSAFGSYSTALENANKAIQQKLDSLSTSKVNAIDIGDRNLVLDSLGTYSGINALHYYNLSQPLIVGQEYAVSVKGDVGTGANFNVWINSDITHALNLPATGIAKGTFVYQGGANPSRISVFSENSANPSTVYWVKIAKGNKATSDWSPAPEDIDASILVAKNAADAANAEIGNITSDGVFDKAEKIRKRQEWEIIAGEVTPLVNQASSFGVSSSAYSNAFTTLANYLNAGATWVSPQIPFFVSDGQLTVNTTFASSSLSSAATFRSRYKSYYDEKIALMNAISAKAKQSGDDANTKITNLKPAGKNYLINSRTDSLVGWIAVGGTMSVATDEQYGKVVEYSRPAGGGDFMKSFTIDTSELKNTELVYYCIAKPISGTTIFNFGGRTETYTQLTNNSPYRNLGNGWRLYYKVFTAGSAIASGVTFGLNSVGGTWRFHSFGVAKGNTPPSDWDASPKEIDFLKQGYQASTDIQGGVVQTAVLLLRNALKEVTAGISGLGGDNVINWGAGTYQDAINDAAKAFGAAMVTSFLNKDDGGGHLAFGKIAWNNAGQLIVDGIIKAIGGKLGLFDILDGSIIGRDSTGIERINISNKSIATTPAGLASGYIAAYDYQDGAVFKGNFYNYGQGDSNTYAQGVLVTNSFYLPTGSNILFGTGFRLYPFSNQSAVINHNMTTNAKIYLNGSFIGTAVDNVPFYVNGAGTVIVEEWFYLSASIVEGDSTDYEIGIAGTGIGFYQATTAKSAMGQNGLYSYWNANKYFYFSEQFGLSVRGATDIPAGLGGASINSSGGMIASSNWGKITGSDKISRSGNNYTITHYIGDTNYSVQIIPGNSTPGTIYFSSKQPNTIVVTCAGAFDFVLIRTK